MWNSNSLPERVISA